LKILIWHPWKQFNENATKSNDVDETPVHAFYLESNVIDNVTETLLSERFTRIDGNMLNFQ